MTQTHNHTDKSFHVFSADSSFVIKWGSCNSSRVIKFDWKGPKKVCRLLTEQTKNQLNFLFLFRFIFTFICKAQLNTPPCKWVSEFWMTARETRHFSLTENRQIVVVEGNNLVAYIFELLRALLSYSWSIFGRGTHKFWNFMW